ncbi:Fatty acid-binding protein [Schistosoma japonicum]|nr:Fatty acid-binding protein [Schistosoma japonicum]
MDGDTMTMLTESTFKNLSVTFKFGEEFDEKTSDGRSVKSVVTKDSESKITQTQKDSKNTTVIVREIVGDTMKTEEFDPLGHVAHKGGVYGCFFVELGIHFAKHVINNHLVMKVIRCDALNVKINLEIK